MKLCLDTEEYNNKPNHKQVIQINKRIVKNQIDISPKQLASEIVKGKSFVPATFNKDADGKYKRQIKLWNSQQIICLDFDEGMTIEQAKREFKNNAMFIYTTFNHSSDHHKFRVVMAANKVITDYKELQVIYDYLHNKYPMADSSCTDGSRLFYGGKELIELNYNNRLCIDSIVNNNKNKLDSNKSHEGFRPYDNITINTNDSYVGTKSKSVETVDNTNVRLIKNKDINKLQKILKPKKVKFHTHEEVYEYLSKQDIQKYLGVNGKYFNCVFHEDNKPSANIYKNYNTDHYVYKCFSDKCTFKSGTIIKATERLLKCRRIDALKFLRKVYRIEYYETKWQKEQKEILEENMRYLISEQFKIDYPELHKRIKNYIGELYVIHSVAKDNLPAEGYTKDQVNALMFASVRYIEKICVSAGMRKNEDIKGMANKLGLFAYLGILFKLQEDQIPDFLLKEAKRQLMKNKEKLGAKSLNMVSFFEIPSYSDDILSFSEEKANEFKNKHLTMRGWSYEMLYRVLGKDEANRVYPQMKGKELSDKSKISTKMIEKETMRLLEKQGWVVEQQVLNNIKLSKNYKQKQIKRVLGELIEKYDLIRRRLNKDLKNKLNCNIKGYPYVIYKE